MSSEYNYCYVLYITPATDHSASGAETVTFDRLDPLQLSHKFRVATDTQCIYLTAVKVVGVCTHIYIYIQAVECWDFPQTDNTGTPAGAFLLTVL